jgi:taurine dioxygenase
VITSSVTIEVLPVSAHLGAEIRGIDLRQPLGDEQRNAIHTALMRHLVVFFREQSLSEDEQLAFARNFGAINTTTANPRQPGPALSHFEDSASSRPNTDHWHTDLPFAPDPPEFAVLQMLDAPALGGDTMWASLYGAYEALSPPMQELVAGLEVEHGLGRGAEYFRRTAGEVAYKEMMSTFRPARHPLVRVHPVTGRPALYLSGEFMNGIAGAEADESALLLGFLMGRLDDPNIQCRWHWRTGDIAMWDERCTVHRGLSDHFPSHRLVRRCLVGAGVPSGL